MNDITLASIRREIQQAQQPLLERIAAQSNEIETLRTQIEEADDWATGVFYALNQILPLLLRDHPKAAEIQQRLQASDDRYEELLAHPQQAEEGEPAGMYEACKMLNRQWAILGVWPNIDPR